MSATAGSAPVPDTARRAAGPRERWSYTDAFAVRTDTGSRASLDWFRHMLEEPPGAIRFALRTVWTLIGVQRGPADDAHVLGLPIVHAEETAAVLSARSWLGADGRLVLEARDGAVTMSSFIDLRTRVSRLAWPLVAPVHRFAVRRLLSRAAR